MKPGVKQIILGALCLLAAIAVPLLIALSVIFAKSDDHQFKVPGTLETIVEKPGRYYVWYNYQTTFEGTFYSRPDSPPDSIQVQVRTESGENLPLISNGSITMTSGSSGKRSIGYVEISKPGKVKVEVSGGTGENIFSFSQSGLLMMFSAIVAGAGLAILFGLAGLALVIWGLVKLTRARKTISPGMA